MSRPVTICLPNCEVATCCSDLHRGKPGHPATDATPGWAPAWAAVCAWTVPEVIAMSARGQCEVRSIKLALGDMNELPQFRRRELLELAPTDVEGNHDRWTGPRDLVLETRRGRTLFTHGHCADPWWAKVFGAPAAWAARVLQCIRRDLDRKAVDLVRRTVGLGCYGDAEKYAHRLAERACRLECEQVVFGHLHELFRSCVVVEHAGRLHRVRVVCTGCCVDGRMDFVDVEV